MRKSCVTYLLTHLLTVELKLAGTVEDAVTVFDHVADEVLCEQENQFLLERVANRTQTKQLEHTAVRCGLPSHCPG